MQAVSDVSDRTREIFENVVLPRIKEVFPPGSDALVQSTNFINSEGGLITVYTDQEGIDCRYDFLDRLRSLINDLRERKDIAFGFNEVLLKEAA